MPKKAKNTASKVLSFCVLTTDESHFTKMLNLRNEIEKNPSITSNKTVYSLFANPERFFNEILEPIKSPSLKTILTFTVYAIIRKVYSANGENIVRDMKAVKPTMSLRNVTDMTENYIVYSLGVIDKILKEGNDAIMDAFNSELLAEKSFRSLIETHNKWLKMYEQDREDISEALQTIRRLKK